MQPNFQNRQINFQQGESDEEIEIIEINERDRYEPNELYPSNINFILPCQSNLNFVSQNKQNVSSCTCGKQYVYQNNSQYIPVSPYSNKMNINNENISNNIQNNNYNINNKSNSRLYYSGNENKIMNQIPQI